MLIFGGILRLFFSDAFVWLLDFVLIWSIVPLSDFTNDSCLSLACYWSWSYVSSYWIDFEIWFAVKLFQSAIESSDRSIWSSFMPAVIPFLDVPGKWLSKDNSKLSGTFSIGGLNFARDWLRRTLSEVMLMMLSLTGSYSFFFCLYGSPRTSFCLYFFAVSPSPFSYLSLGPAWSVRLSLGTTLAAFSMFVSISVS